MAAVKLEVAGVDWGLRTVSVARDGEVQGRVKCPADRVSPLASEGDLLPVLQLADLRAHRCVRHLRWGTAGHGQARLGRGELARGLARHLEALGLARLARQCVPAVTGVDPLLRLVVRLHVVHGRVRGVVQIRDQAARDGGARLVLRRANDGRYSVACIARAAVGLDVIVALAAQLPLVVLAAAWVHLGAVVDVLAHLLELVRMVDALVLHYLPARLADAPVVRLGVARGGLHILARAHLAAGVVRAVVDVHAGWRLRELAVAPARDGEEVARGLPRVVVDVRGVAADALVLQRCRGVGDELHAPLLDEVGVAQFWRDAALNRHPLARLRLRERAVGLAVPLKLRLSLLFTRERVALLASVGRRVPVGDAPRRLQLGIADGLRGSARHRLARSRLGELATGETCGVEGGGARGLAVQRVAAVTAVGAGLAKVAEGLHVARLDRPAILQRLSGRRASAALHGLAFLDL
mmetsp:Transcript_61543/g.164657  ORF Transcript_61543/g.164657 Transcript_61543/m.164657 type:complete len:467 (+) Transcript_61543:214-1614(+)